MYKYFHTITKLNNSKNDDVSEEDAKIVSQQLNARRFTKPRAILKRCKWGYPQIVFSLTNRTSTSVAQQKTKTLVPGTLVWITCPRVKQLISSLESRHIMHSLPIHNAKDLKESNQRYVEWLKKSGLLNEEEYEHWETANKCDGVQRRFGNSGSANQSHIKCLHAHVAVYMIGIEDHAGKEAYEYMKKEINNEEKGGSFNDLDCPKDCIECSKFKNN